ncbi:metal ABC transporter ATP-binding protein [Bacillus carboniphilus]|uniref:Metal ABC transporter ATP-binding protein n=1 Tax=Bacillus carboniphilus TaxID=86663 RepID=A0ABP3GKI5_9BACI
MNPAVKVNNLCISYHGKIAVKDIKLTIDQGKMVGIIGPNGAGKSTLLKAMLNIIPADCGEIEFFGKSLKDHRKSIAYVPQRSNIDWDFPISVFDTVLLGTYPNLGVFKKPKKKEKEWALECLQRVGLEEYRDRQIGELSGGQQQRVFLARALAQKSEFLFLDEPFVGVDVVSEKLIISILKELKESGKTILVVHHDLSKVNEYFEQLILLNKELISFGEVDRVFRTDILTKAYSDQFSFLKGMGVAK